MLGGGVCFVGGGGLYALPGEEMTWLDSRWNSIRSDGSLPFFPSDLICIRGNCMLANGNKSGLLGDVGSGTGKGGALGSP